MNLTPTRDDPFSFGPEVQEALAAAKVADLWQNQPAIDHLIRVP